MSWFELVITRNTSPCSESIYLYHFRNPASSEEKHHRSLFCFTMPSASMSSMREVKSPVWDICTACCRSDAVNHTAPRFIEDVQAEVPALEVHRQPNELDMISGKSSEASQWQTPSKVPELFAADPSLLRGISPKETLRKGGRLWYSEKHRSDAWAASRQTEQFGIFFSHAWATDGRWKVLSLSLKVGWMPFLLTWLGTVVAAEVLWCLDVLPTSGSYSAMHPEFPADVPFGGWAVFLAVPLSLLALVLTPHLPSICRQPELCFLDAVSINRTDEDMKKRGIYALGSFLQASKELRILWSPPYFSRLWCDPASPARLTAPLVESLRRISRKFSGNGKGRCLHRLFLDDRSWFCEKRKTCLDIGLEWRREVSLWGLGENKSKADFGVVGTASDRRNMQAELTRREQVGEVKLRPRLLGSRLHTNRAHSKPQAKRATGSLKLR